MCGVDARGAEGRKASADDNTASISVRRAEFPTPGDQIPEFFWNVRFLSFFNNFCVFSSSVGVVLCERHLTTSPDEVSPDEVCVD